MGIYSAQVTEQLTEQLLLDLQDRSLGSVLPLKTLRNVKDLTLSCHLHNIEEPEWPTTWSQLTNMTKLAFGCDEDLTIYHRPEFLTELRSLQELKFTTEFDHFERTGEEYLILIAMCLPFLQSIVVVRNPPPHSEFEPFQGALEKIKQICLTVSRRMPSMLYTYLETYEEEYTQTYYPEGGLDFTLERKF